MYVAILCCYLSFFKDTFLKILGAYFACGDVNVLNELCHLFQKSRGKDWPHRSRIVRALGTKPCC